MVVFPDQKKLRGGYEQKLAKGLTITFGRRPNLRGRRTLATTADAVEARIFDHRDNETVRDRAHAGPLENDPPAEKLISL
jgi:hypothetical protein